MLPVIEAASSSEPFLGADLLPLLVLAIGAALVVGNGMALFRPPNQPNEGDLPRAPIGRSLTMAIVGLIAAIWAIATLTH